ncbi:MAG: hypothetical protein ACI8UO_003910 [Verrucomicrobiales bacterium]|jgi:hypothetical protein
MKTEAKIFSALAFFILTLSAEAQLSAEIDRVKIEKLKTPRFGLAEELKRPTKPENWSEIEVEFVLSGTAENEIAPQIAVDFYVVLSDGSVLYRQVVYENLLLREETFASVFISPDGLRALRIGENPGISIIGAGAEISDSTGEILATESSAGDLVSPAKANPKRIAGVLRKKSQTPFASLWWDRYAEEKLD